MNAYTIWSREGVEPDGWPYGVSRSMRVVPEVMGRHSAFRLEVGERADQGRAMEGHAVDEGAVELGYLLRYRLERQGTV